MVTGSSVRVPARPKAPPATPEAAAEIAEGRGLRVGYHNHGHELEANIDGQTGLELLASLLDPRVVLEVDLYWAARAGVAGTADVVWAVTRRVPGTAAAGPRGARLRSFENQIENLFDALQPQSQSSPLSFG